MSGLFYFNEAPLNLKDSLTRMILGRCCRVSSSRATASAAAVTEEEEKPRGPVKSPPVAEAMKSLLRLPSPRAEVAESSVFSLYRRIQKQYRKFANSDTLSLSAFAHLAGRDDGKMVVLEEPILLLPSMARSSATLGMEMLLPPSPPPFSTRSSAAGEGEPLQLCMGSSVTEYRVDYYTCPMVYILGIPAALLGSADGVDLSTRATQYLSSCVLWNPSSNQFVLKRRLAVRAAAMTCDRACLPSSSSPDPSATAALEDYIFLGQTYSFDPHRAYYAARVAAGCVGAAGDRSATSYALVYFTHVTGPLVESAAVDALRNLGRRYPSCYRSACTEVDTTVKWAASASCGASSPSSLAAATAAASIPVKAKHLRMAAPAGSGAAHLWGSQVSGSRVVRGSADQARRKSGSSSSSAVDGGAGGGEHGASTRRDCLQVVAAELRQWGGQLRQMIRQAGNSQQGTPATRAEAAASPLSPSSPPTNRGNDASCTTGSAASPKCNSSAAVSAAAEVVRRLSLESPNTPGGPATAAASPNRGCRFSTTAVVAGIPLIFRGPPASMRPDVEHPMPKDGAVAAGEAPLAAALWMALYGPPHSCQAVSPSLPRGHSAVYPLPMALDRLMYARDTVLMPFLRQPRSSSSLAVHRIGAQLGICSSTTASTSSAPATPLLWRLNEIEAACGWRRHRDLFYAAFGPLESQLLARCEYATLGHTAAATASSPDAAVATTTTGPPRDPVVLPLDRQYMQGVLLAAMQDYFHEYYVFASNGVQLEMRNTDDWRFCTAAAAAAEAGALWGSTATAVATHQMQISSALHRLQAASSDALRCWVELKDEGPSESDRGKADFSLEWKATVRRFLFAGLQSDVEALAGHFTKTDEAMQYVRALQPTSIAAIPVLPFLRWAANDSKQERPSAPAAPLVVFSERDVISFYNYTMHAPELFCWVGGCGGTVAIRIPPSLPPAT